MIKSLIKILLGKKEHQEVIENNNEDPLIEFKEKLEISRYCIFNSNYHVYYFTKYSYKTPIEVLKLIKNEIIIWFDDKNKLLGFSNKERSLIFKPDTVKNFEIGNILPAKGPGYSYFSIRLLNEDKIFDLFLAGPKEFDKYAPEIFGLTGVEVIFAPEYYDC